MNVTLGRNACELACLYCKVLIRKLVVGHTSHFIALLPEDYLLPFGRIDFFLFLGQYRKFWRFEFVQLR